MTLIDQIEDVVVVWNNRSRKRDTFTQNSLFLLYITNTISVIFNSKKNKKTKSLQITTRTLSQIDPSPMTNPATLLSFKLRTTGVPVTGAKQMAALFFLGGFFCVK